MGPGRGKSYSREPVWPGGLGEPPKFGHRRPAGGQKASAHLLLSRELSSSGNKLVRLETAARASIASSHHSDTTRSWRSPIRSSSSLPVSAGEAVPCEKRLCR